MSLEKAAEARIQGGLLAFDALLGSLFLLGSRVSFIRLHSPASEGADSAASIGLIACFLDAGIASVLICAGVCLLVQSRLVVLFQRAVFWALLIRSAFVGLELFLPSEGGVGGLGLIGGLLLLLVLTFMALAVALSLGCYEKQEKPLRVMTEQPGV